MKMSFTQNAAIAKGVTASFLILVALARGQSLADTNSAPASIPYATLQYISSNDSSEVIVEKAAHVLPRPNQTTWMRLEWTFFLHFGMNTFTGRSTEFCASSIPAMT